MTDIELIERAVEEEAERILAANDRIWGFAELPFHEDKSAGLLCGLLEESGFTVETGLAGIPTCFTGTFSFGSGRPVMGILGEYDALSGLSQEAAVPVKKELMEGAPGHGCGHCALGTGALAAAIAVKKYPDRNSSWPVRGCLTMWILYTHGILLRPTRWIRCTAMQLWEPTFILKD